MKTPEKLRREYPYCNLNLVQDGAIKEIQADARADLLDEIINLKVRISRFEDLGDTPRRPRGERHEMSAYETLEELIARLNDQIHRRRCQADVSVDSLDLRRLMNEIKACYRAIAALKGQPPKP